MNKIVTSLSCLILLPSFLAFSAEGPAIDVVKLLAKKQEWHKDLIAKDACLVDVYESYIREISELNSNGDSGLNQVYGKCKFEMGRLACAVKNKDQAAIIPEILDEQSKLIKEGLILTKNHPEFNLKLNTPQIVYHV